MRPGIPKPPAAAQDEQPHIASGHCCIAGCKLPGTILGSTTGGSDWYCRLHFGAAYSDLADITLRANNRIGLYRLALEWANEPPNTPVPDAVVETLRRFRCEDLMNAPVPVEGRGMTMRTLAKHVLGRLDAQCRDPKTPTAEPPKARDTWASAGDVVEDAFA